MARFPYVSGIIHNLNQPMLSPTDALFTSALGLTQPWYCKNSDFSADKSRLDLCLDFPADSRFTYYSHLVADLSIAHYIEAW
jgi:hypothetical protein